MFGGFMLADISFWDMCASGGAFNSGSVVLFVKRLSLLTRVCLWGCLYFCKCSCLGKVSLSRQCFELKSTINNILRIVNFPAVNTFIVAFKGFKNTVSVYTGLAAWKINDFH